MQYCCKACHLTRSHLAISPRGNDMLMRQMRKPACSRCIAVVAYSHLCNPSASDPVCVCRSADSEANHHRCVFQTHPICQHLPTACQWASRGCGLHWRATNGKQTTMMQRSGTRCSLRCRLHPQGAASSLVLRCVARQPSGQVRRRYSFKVSLSAWPFTVCKPLGVTCAWVPVDAGSRTVAAIILRRSSNVDLSTGDSFPVHFALRFAAHF